MTRRYKPPPKRLILDFDATGMRWAISLVWLNKRLQRQSWAWMERAETHYLASGNNQWMFASINYCAGTGARARRVIVKAQHNHYGANPCFVVTHLTRTDRYLYDKIYCARGDMENRIKNQQLDLFANRNSCHRGWPNQLRRLLSGLAYTLFEGLRRRALKDTELAQASRGRIGRVVLNIGAVVIRNTRRIRLLMSSACPHQALYRRVSFYLDTS